MQNVSHSAFIFGGPGGDRTHDLSVANAALSQLSYEPITFHDIYYTIKFTSVKGFLKKTRPFPGAADGRCENF